MKIKNLLTIGVLIAGVCLSGLAQTTQTTTPIVKPFFTGKGTAVGTTLSYGVVSALSANGGTPVITSIDADSDLATSALRFYYVPQAPTSCNYVSTTTSIPVSSTNGFLSGDIIIIRHAGTDTYERRILTTFTSATNLTVTVAPTVATAVNDLVYRATTNAIINWGAIKDISGSGIGGTNYLQNRGGIAVGQPNYPLLFDLDGTSLVHINGFTADYRKPE